MRNRIFLYFCMFLVAFTCIFVSPKFAFAAGGKDKSGHTHKQAATVSPNYRNPLDCFNNPSDNTCDNIDPNDANCAYPAGYPKTVATLVLTDGQLAGGTDKSKAIELQLRYSDTCKTNWTHAYSYTNISIGGYEYDSFYIDGVRIVRDDGLAYTYYTGGYYTEGWTNMIYSPVRKAQACVQYSSVATSES